MTITTRTELIAAICDYLEDGALESRAPLFIQLAEAMFKRRLRTLDAQGTSTTTAAAIIALPSDFNGIISVNLSDYGPLAQLGADDFQSRYAEDTATGVPEYYMLANGSFHLGPPPDSAYTVTLHYLRKLTALSASNTSNWLLAAHPDLYLYASLLQAEMFGWNDARLPLLKAATDEALGEIVMSDARNRRAALVGDVPADYF